MNANATILTHLLELVRVLARSWTGVAQSVFRVVADRLGLGDIRRAAFLAASFGLMVFGLFDWVAYQAALPKPESFTVGSKFKIVFLMPGGLGWLLAVISVWRGRQIYYGVLVIAALFYLIGIFAPGFAHANFVDSGEYTIRYFPVAAYGVFLAIAAYTAGFALEDPAIRPTQLAKMLTTVPDRRLLEGSEESSDRGRDKGRLKRASTSRR